MIDTERKITLAELLHVKEIMDFHSRDSGWMSITPAGKVEFFDSEPSFGGAKITRTIINKAIENASRTDRDSNSPGT